MNVPDTSTVSITHGSTHKVGGFFWINDNDFIGYAPGATHGHGLPKSPGSVDDCCTVKILKVGETHSIVQLDRHEIPFGARAPIGTVFQIPNTMILSWPAMLRARNDRDAQRRAILRELF